MSEWKTVQLLDLLGQPTRNGLTKPKSVRGSGYKMVNMGEIFKYNRIFDVAMELVPLNDKEKESSSLKEGDLIFARQSLTFDGAGKCVIIKEINELAVFESHIIRVRLNQELCDSDYYYYYFNSFYGRKNIENIVEQVAAAGIRGSDLVKLYVPFPPLPEQKAIADTLSCLDEKIESNNKINQILEEMAQAIFKNWFVDFEPFGGEMPEDWRVATLDECCDFSNGYAFKSKELLDKECDDCYHVFKMGHIVKGGGFNSNGTKSWVRIEDC